MNMKQMYEYKPLFAFLCGIVLILMLGYFYNPFEKSAFDGLPTSEEVHVHSDFLMVINDEEVDFTDDKYQSRTGHVLLKDFHMHDNNDEVIHRHAKGLTLAQFLSSLGYTLTQDCLTTDTNEQYCTNENSELILFVNDTAVSSVETYTPQEGDHILVYYGEPDAERIQTYTNEVTNDACIYSGTCPERGAPPPESCGLTCEI